MTHDLLDDFGTVKQMLHCSAILSLSPLHSSFPIFLLLVSMLHFVAGDIDFAFCDEQNFLEQGLKPYAEINVMVLLCFS